VIVQVCEAGSDVLFTSEGYELVPCGWILHTLISLSSLELNPLYVKGEGITTNHRPTRDCWNNSPGRCYVPLPSAT
jgi:hypothetical protein